MKKLTMTFRVTVDYDSVTTDNELKTDFNNDINELCAYLYNNEGIWWDNDMEFIKAEIISEEQRKIAGGTST